MESALDALPHGPSFRFVSELTALDPGKSGSGLYHLRGDEDFLAGHFPGHPLLPGVLMIEAVAQLGGVVAQSDPAHPALLDLRLAAVQNAKIQGTIGPGSTLELTAAVTGRLGGLILIEGSAAQDGRILLTARLSLGGTLPPE